MVVVVVGGDDGGSGVLVLILARSVNVGENPVYAASSLNKHPSLWMRPQDWPSRGTRDAGLVFFVF